MIISGKIFSFSLFSGNIDLANYVADALSDDMYGDCICMCACACETTQRALSFPMKKFPH